MKRGLIVTGVWSLFTVLVFLTAFAVADHSNTAVAPQDLANLHAGLGVLGVIWFASLPLMALMWIILIFRWVLGGKPAARPPVGYVAPPAPSPPAVAPSSDNAGHRWLG